MPIQQMEPKEAKAAMDAAEKAIYLDVRTEMEFAQGHPEGAINIPAAVPGPGGMVQNPQFLLVVEKTLTDKNQPIFCGCQVGVRSQMAAEWMARAGYANLINVQGGFGGRMLNGVLIKGWRDCGLLVGKTITEENSYAGLKKKAGV